MDLTDLLFDIYSVLMFAVVAIVPISIIVILIAVVVRLTRRVVFGRRRKTVTK